MSGTERPQCFHGIGESKQVRRHMAWQAAQRLRPGHLRMFDMLRCGESLNRHRSFPCGTSAIWTSRALYRDAQREESRPWPAWTGRHFAAAGRLLREGHSLLCNYPCLSQPGPARYVVWRRSPLREPRLLHTDIGGVRPCIVMEESSIATCRPMDRSCSGPCRHRRA